MGGGSGSDATSCSAACSGRACSEPAVSCVRPMSSSAMNLQGCRGCRPRLQGLQRAEWPLLPCACLAPQRGQQRRGAATTAANAYAPRQALASALACGRWGRTGARCQTGRARPAGSPPAPLCARGPPAPRSGQGQADYYTVKVLELLCRQPPQSKAHICWLHRRRRRNGTAWPGQATSQPALGIHQRHAPVHYPCTPSKRTW